MTIRILVVEDEPNLSRGLCDNLEYEGYKVTVAENGVDGHDAGACGRLSECGGSHGSVSCLPMR